MSNSNLPAFTPLVATPVQPPTEQPNGAVKPKRAKKVTKKPGKKAAKAAPAEAPKRQRSSRVAPLQMDAASALAAVAGLGKKEVEVLQTLIAQLNPLPRPARARVLQSVASILSTK